jgi:hypothetical protein
MRYCEKIISHRKIRKTQVSNHRSRIKLVLRTIEAPQREIVNNAGGKASVVASLMLTTECMISESPKDDAPAMGGGDMGGMGGMGGMGM